MNDLKASYILLKSKVVIRKTGNQFFLVNTSFDYSKQKLISLTSIGAQIVEFVKQRRSIAEIFEHFNIDYAEYKDFYELFDFLHNNGYIFYWDTNRLNKEFISSIVKNEFAINHVPFNATIELLSGCNFQCIHCYLGEKRTDNYEMDTEQIKYILDKLAEAGMLVLYFSGGEPLLRKDFSELYLYAKKKGFLVVLFTNGYLLNSELLDIFIENPPLELDISLYGSSDEIYTEITGVQGAFTRIKENISLFKSKGINISLKSPVMLNLSDELSGMYAFAKELDVPLRISFDINPTLANESKAFLNINAATAVDLYAKYSDAFKGDSATLIESLSNESFKLTRNRYACGMGKCSCFIDYQGKVSPCIETRFLGVSIFDNEFNDIWEKIKRITYSQLQDSDEFDYKCLRCNKASICKSCPAIREKKYGSPIIVKEEDCAYAIELYKKIMGGEKLE